MANTTQIERGAGNMILVTDYDYERVVKAQVEEYKDAVLRLKALFDVFTAPNN